MSQLGRISGQLLKENLTRNGHDLTFDNDLLHLDVTGRKIGIKNTAPGAELDVTGTTRTTNLEVTNQSDLGDITVLGNTITSNTGILNLTNGAGNQITYQTQLAVDDITITSNIISTNNGNVNLELRPNGIGTVDIYADTNVYGNITVTGNIRTDGTITVGDDNTDNITINADVASNIIPDQTNTYTLGDVTHQWKDVWVQNVYADDIVSGDITVDGVNLTTRQGNTYYVSVNGKDTNSGTHQNNTFRTIRHAVLAATAGETVFVYPGVYEEQCPIQIPIGVTVHGVSLRSVMIKPTAATMYNDMFHIGGEATVEDFTIMGLQSDPLAVSPEFGADGNGTGHAFRFHANALVTSRSPYIRNVTVLTYGTASVLSVNSIKTEVIGSLTRIKTVISDIVSNVAVSATIGNSQTQNTLLDDSDPATGSLLENLLDDVIYIINNGTLLANLPSITANGTAVTTGMLYNAAAILVANRDWIIDESYAYPTYTYSPTTFDETLTKRDMGYIIDALVYDIIRGGNEHSVYAGLGFWVHPTDDPRGYARADAGHGALIDGSVMHPDSKEAAMLFHSVTFITPAADTLIAKNGARVEWLNSFTYFAEKGMNLVSGTLGFASNGKTRVKITDTTGTWAVGNTLSYYDTDGTTVLASGVIESIDGNFYNIDGRILGFETLADRPGKTISVHGNAKLATAIKKFGSASLVLDGVGDYLTVPTQTDFALGGGAWCIEGWIYNTTAPGVVQTIFDFRNNATAADSIILNIQPGSTLNFYANGGPHVTGAAIPLNTWTHIALACDGTSTRLFINGTQSGLTYTDTHTYIQGPVTIGAQYDGTLGFYGNLDDIKISKGVARYTSNFTAPTAQLTGDLSTVLLITCNGANNSTAIADNGVTLQDLRTSALGTASIIDFADYSDFGAEVRSIGSACVYGDYGIYGDGPGVIAYLVGQNLAYIGNGKETDNDPTTVIQANEIVELNGAKIYYQSADAKGDFRIGDLFYVNQQTGEVSFPNSNITIGTSLTFDNGLGDVTYLDATKIETGDFRISGNTVETLTQDFNIQAASNLINLESNVTITGNLDVTGNVTIGGNITIGDQSTDTVSFVAGVDSDIVPNNPLGVPVYNLGTLAKQWLNLYSAQLTIGDVQIDTNVVRTTLTNANLSLQANGTGKIYVPSNNVQLDQNLTVNGTTYLKDTTIVGTVTHTGAVTQTGDVTQIGNVGITGTLTVSSYAQFQDIKVDTNQVTTTLGNNNLELAAHGTGKIYVPSNDVQIDQNLTVNGTIYTNALQVTQPLEANKFTTGDITIEDNIITTTIGNNNLELRAAGTGLIEFEQFQVQENELKMSTSADMVLTPNGTGIVNINSTQSIKVPVGTTGERPGTPVAGMIRFNTSLTRYEGYDGTNWVRLDGVADVDNNTYITAELTPGANDNTFRFVTNSVQVADLNSTRLNVINVDVDSINLNDNVISTNVTDTDLLVQTSGTGSVKIGNLAFKDNSITNYVSNSITVLNQTGDSYFKVAGTYGLVIPSGETLERPITVERGMMRFNTTDQRVEIFDGTDWVSAAGSSSGITVVEATDLSIISAIIFG